MQVQAETSLSEWSAELHALRAATDAVCAHRSPPLLIEVALLDRLWALPSHVDHVVLEGVLHGSSMALG